MSAQPETLTYKLEQHAPTAAERAYVRWGLGRLTVTLSAFAERASIYPDRDDKNPEYDDKTGTIVLGYN